MHWCFLGLVRLPASLWLCCPRATNATAPIGTDTTAHALVTGTWHLLQNPAMLRRLRRELCDAIIDPDSSTMLSWIELEKLPFLVGCDAVLA